MGFIPGQMRSLTVFDRNFFIIAIIFQKVDVHFKQKHTYVLFNFTMMM
jgi:hypothetical protein